MCVSVTCEIRETVSRCGGEDAGDVAVRIDDDRLTHVRGPNQIACLGKRRVVEPLHNHRMMPRAGALSTNQLYVMNRPHRSGALFSPAFGRLSRGRGCRVLSESTTAQSAENDSARATGASRGETDPLS